MEKASGTVAGSIGGLWSGSSNSWIFGNEQGFTGNRAAGYGTDRSNRRNHTRIERSAGK